MLFPVVFFIAAASSALASPAPSPAPTPILREIAHVRSSALCTEVTTHVNSLIGSATRNDTQLSQLVSTLRVPDWNRNDLARNQQLQALSGYADGITAEWKRGEDEAARLRELSKRATDKDEQAAITSSADALAGALWRQRKIARDLDGFVAYLYAEDVAKVHDGEGQMNESIFGHDDVHDAAILGDGTQRRPVPPDGMWRAADVMPGRNAPPDPEQAKAAAREFETHFPEIAGDEQTAAGRIAAATNHC